jgi:hypothetical protein
LTKKAPRANVEDKEEFDEFDGTGSFFNFFTDEGEDPTGMGEILLEWFGHATESVLPLLSSAQSRSRGRLPLPRR